MIEYVEVLSLTNAAGNATVRVCKMRAPLKKREGAECVALLREDGTWWDTPDGSAVAFTVPSDVTLDAQTGAR